MSRNSAGSSTNVTSSSSSSYLNIPPDNPPEGLYTVVYNQGTDSEGSRFGFHDELDGDGEPVHDFERTYKLTFQNVQQSFPMAFQLGIKGPNPPLPDPSFTVTGATEKDSVDGETTKPYTAFYMTDAITDSTEVLVTDELKTKLVGTSANTELYRRWSLSRVGPAEAVAITSSELIDLGNMEYALVVPASAGGDYLSSIDPDTGEPVYNINLRALYLHKPDRMKVSLSWTPDSAAKVWHTPFKALTNGGNYFDGEITNSHSFVTKDDENPIFIEMLDTGAVEAELKWGIGDRYHSIKLIKVDLDIVHPATGELDEAKEDSVGGYVAKEYRTGLQTKLRIHPTDIEGVDFRLKFNSNGRYRLLKEDGTEVISESTVFSADTVSNITIEGSEYSEQKAEEEVIVQLVSATGHVADGDSVRFSVVPAQFEMFFKAFIPYQWVRILGHPLYDNRVVAKGDDRDFADDVSASTRMGQVAIVIPYPDLDANGIGSISGGEFAVSWTGTTEHYNYTDLTNPFTTAAHQGLEPQTRIIEGSSPADSGVAPTDEMYILPPDSRDPNTNKVTISFNGSAGEPIVIGAPPIDYEIDITIDSSDPLAPTFKVTGWQDGFPAYEGYARPLDLDNSSSGFTPMYQWQPELSATVLRLGVTHNETLPDDVEGSININ